MSVFDRLPSVHLSYWTAVILKGIFNGCMDSRLADTWRKIITVTHSLPVMDTLSESQIKWFVPKAFWLNLNTERGFFRSLPALAFFRKNFSPFYIFSIYLFSLCCIPHIHPLCIWLPVSLSPSGSWSTERHSSPMSPSSRYTTTSSHRSRSLAAVASCSWSWSAGRERHTYRKT